MSHSVYWHLGWGLGLGAVLGISLSASIGAVPAVVLCGGFFALCFARGMLDVLSTTP